jgi:hypothetical protein
LTCIRHDQFERNAEVLNIDVHFARTAGEATPTLRRRHGALVAPPSISIVEAGINPPAHDGHDKCRGNIFASTTIP